MGCHRVNSPGKGTKTEANGDGTAFKEPKVFFATMQTARGSKTKLYFMYVSLKFRNNLIF